MKLTQDQIKSIDTYLKNTDIHFVDVRMELLDHIASAVEQDMEENNQSFYDAFKAYMVLKKKQLEKDYEKLRKDLQKKSFGVLGRKMITVPFLVLFVISLCALYFWEFWFRIPVSYVVCIYAITIVSVASYAIFGLTKKHNRISSLEMLIWPIFVTSYSFNLYFQIFYNKELFTLPWSFSVMILTSFVITVNFAFLALFFQKRKEAKQRLA